MHISKIGIYQKSYNFIGFNDFQQLKLINYNHFDYLEPQDVNLHDYMIYFKFLY